MAEEDKNDYVALHACLHDMMEVAHKHGMLALAVILETEQLPNGTFGVHSISGATSPQSVGEAIALSERGREGVQQVCAELDAAAQRGMCQSSQIVPGATTPDDTVN